MAVAKAGHLLATDEVLDENLFCISIADAVRPFDSTFSDLIADLPNRLREDRDTAFRAIAWSGSSKPEFSRPVITPFVVPTVLASLWAVLRHPLSWPDAVSEVIQLGGDVDTLGAIVGALMGIRLGESAIPERLVSEVLHSDRIHLLARRYHLAVTSHSGASL